MWPLSAPRARAMSCGVLLLLAAAAAHAENPFSVRSVQVEGRPLQVVAGDVGGPAGRPELVVVSVQGVPPDEKRILSVFAWGPDGLPARPSRTIQVDDDVVAFDVASVGEEGGGLVLLRRDGVEVRQPLASPPSRRAVPVADLPLIPRTRDLSRLPLVDDWNADGQPAALIPTLDGARLVRLADGAARSIRIPLLTEYWTVGWENPPQAGFLTTTVDWPVLARADDDGDGRLDLFALSRFGANVYRAGEGGLPEQPDRRMHWRPFSAEEEMRFQATEMQLFAQDLDGDRFGDIVVHATSGRLVDSHTKTTVHRGPGRNGAASDPIRIELADAISSVEPRDLDGDGRVELVQGMLRFGVLQVLRALAQRQIRAEIRVLTLPAKGDTTEVTWSGEITVALDFRAGRVAGLLPTTRGDWNGDGRHDLLFGPDARTVELRMGSRGAKGPGFDGPTAGQAVPPMDLAVVADLDGDGLDDLVLYDPRDDAGAIHVLRNRGILPGTRPSIGPPAR